jgi:hypothetical protein
MSNIVDWLKKECPRDSLARDARLQEAADEIEALRQRVADLQINSSKFLEINIENEQLRQRVAELEHAIDDKMVVAHLGTFEKDDDPNEAVCKLMNYAQGLGEYFAKDQIVASQARDQQLGKALK